MSPSGKGRAVPAHEVFKKLGNLGLLGLKYPEEYGGGPGLQLLDGDGRGAGRLRLRRRADGHRRADRHVHAGPGALRQRRAAPRVPGAPIAGDMVGCIGVSEPGGGSDVAAVKTSAKQGRRRLRHQRQQDVDHQRHAGRLVLPAGQHLGRPGTRTSRLIVVPMNAPGITRQKIHKIGMDSSDTAQLFFDNVRVPQRT
jgi:citronellyl-CoA dehydrogenase